MSDFLIIVLIIIAILVLAQIGKNKNKQSVSSPKSILDFFNYDLRSIPLQDDCSVRTEINIMGREVKHYEFALSKLELGLFSHIELIEIDENKYNVVFTTTKQLITDDLVDFIKFCTNNLGKIRYETGSLSIDNLNKGLYCRQWENVWIEQDHSTANISITLFRLQRTTK